tara:strand:+ start:11896 stop:12510 length:615 start_codon:yes stop_codon:yes gene_type:complete
MIGIVDYGCGNINAFLSAYKYLNIQSKIIKNLSDLSTVNKIILPGVGSFDYVMDTFIKSGLREAVQDKVLLKKVPILGVCAGMQILSAISDEGKISGLGWVEGKVKSFKSLDIPMDNSIPHMGWNCVFFSDNNLFKNIKQGSRFYFVHSFFFDNYNKEDQIAYTKYPKKFTSAIRKNNIYGVQFHPEKSHINGLELLKNFNSIT